MDDEVGVKLSLKGGPAFVGEVGRADASIEKLATATKHAHKSFRDMASSSGGSGLFSRALGGITSLAKKALYGITALAAGAVALGVKIFNLGKDAFETQQKFDTVFAGAGTSAAEWVKTMQKTYGIATKDLQDAVSQFGVLGQGAGIAQTDVSNFSTALAQAGLDLSSFHNVDVKTVFEDISSGLVGEIRPLRKYGIELTETSMAAYALSKGVKTAWSSMTDGQKVLLRQQYIVEHLGVAQGDLARTSGSAANQLRQLGGRIKEAGSKLGLAMLPALNNVIMGLNKRLPDAASWLERRMPAVIDRVTQGFRDVIEIGRSLISFFMGTGSSADAVAIRVDNLFGGTGIFVNGVKSVVKTISNLWDILQNVIIPVLKDLGDSIPISPLKAMEDVTGFIADHGEAMKPVIVTLLALAAGFKIVALATLAWDAALAINPVFLLVGALVALAIELVYAWQKSERFRFVVTETFRNIGRTVMEVKDGIVSAWEAFIGFFEKLPGRIASAASGMWDGIKDAFKAAINWIIHGWNALDFKLPSFSGLTIAGVQVIPSWEGSTLGMPDIDPLANGGIATRSGGLQMVAEAGRPEIISLPAGGSVAPIPHAASLRDALGGTDGGTQHFELYIDGKQVEAVVRKRARDRVARQ